MYWHLRLRVIRRGSEYNITRENLNSTMRMFLSSNQIYCFSIGSAENDSIIIKGLAPNHAMIKIENSSLSLESNKNYEVFIQDGSRSKTSALERRLMEAGQKHVLSMESSTLDWKMVFPDQTVLLCKIFRAKESLIPGIQGYLDLDYGIIDQIQESPVSLIFKTKNKKKECCANN